MENRPLVSIWMITYNHEPFIAQALESVLMQKTSFPFELIIGEDCSSDSTANIVREYAQKFPDIIKARCNSQNIGVTANVIQTLKECTGKYIAMLEGDDYWTDSNKLQKQVDFLERNSDFSFTCHRIYINDLIKGEKYADLKDNLFENHVEGLVLDINSYKSGLLRTLTIVFRSNILNIIPLASFKIFSDSILSFYLLKSGKGYCFNSFWAIYNKNANSIYGGRPIIEQAFHSYSISHELYNYEKHAVVKYYFIKSTIELLMAQLQSKIIKVNNCKLVFLLVFNLQIKFLVKIYIKSILKLITIRAKL